MHATKKPSFSLSFACSRIRTVRQAVKLATVSFLVLLQVSTQGAIINKANNSDALNLSSSWSSSVPGINDVAQWTSTVLAANSTATLGADLTWRGIIFTNPGSAFTITGSNTLTLGNNGINMNTATQNLTISSNLRLLENTSQVWNVLTGQTLALNTGTFTRSIGSSIHVQGGGTVSATNISNDTTGIVGTWAIIGTGATIRYASMSGGNMIGYTGATAAATGADVTSTAGTLNYDVAAAGTFGAGASVNTLRYTGSGSATLAGNITTNGLLNASSASSTLTLTGNVTIGASKELVVVTPDTSRHITISGIISDHASGSSALTKASEGTLTLSGTNTYTGITYISKGNVTITNASALGSTLGGTMITSGDNTSSTTAVVMPGGTLNISGGLTIAESIAVQYGSGNPISAITTSGNTTISGRMLVTANGQLSTSGGGIRLNISSSDTTTFTGGIVTNNAQAVFNGNTGSTWAFRNTALNFGTGNFYVDQVQTTAVIDVAGNMWGETMASTNLRTDVANALPNTTVVRIGVSYQPSGNFNLNGNDQTVGQIRSDSFLQTGTRIVTSTAAATLTVNQSVNSVLDARLTGAVSLTKTGSGALTLAGTSTTTGKITVNRGTLIESFNYASAAAAAGSNTISDLLPASTAPLVMGGGTFQLLGRNNGTATALTGAYWSSGSNTINVASTAGLAPGQLVTSPSTGIPSGAYVVAVLNSTQFLLSVNTTAAVAQASATTMATGGASSFTSSQTFNSTTLNAGGSAISVNANGGDGTVLNLGDIIRNQGGTVAFTLPSGTQSATNGITTNTTNTNGILGGWATLGDNWAINSSNAAGGNIIALSTYVDVTRQNSGSKTINSNTTSNIRVIEGTGGTAASITPSASGTTDINTLLMTATGGAVTYDPGATDVLRFGAEGGILLASTAASINIGASANDGIVTAGGADNTNGNLYLTNNNSTTSNTITINSTITDNGTGVVNVIKSGVGTAVLNGTNTYTGKTYIGGGRLSIAAETALGSTISGGATDQLTLAGGTLQTTASFTIDDSNRGITLAPAGGTFETNSGTTLTIANVIAGTGDLIKAGTGTLRLSNANTFSGETIVNSSTGILELNHVNALQNSTLVTGGSINLVVSGTNNYNLGGLRGSGNLAIGGNTLTVGSNNIATVYAGSISGTNGNLIKTGIAVLNLTNASTHTGTTTLDNGYLGVFHVNALQNSTLDTGAFSTTKAVQFLPNLGTFNLGGLQGADDIDIGVDNISVGSNNASTTFSGAIISGFNGGVTKVGSGTLSLTGANTYTGSTTVNAGVLKVGNAGAGQTGSGAVTVNANAQIIGTGTIRGSSFTLSANATLRPGDTVADSSHGTLTFSPIGAAAYNFQAGSTTIISISSTNRIDGTLGNFVIGSPEYNAYIDSFSGVSGNHDLLDFNGTAGSTLDFSGKLQVVGDNFTAVGGQIFNIMDWVNLVTTNFAVAYSPIGFQDGLSDNGSQFDLPDLNSAVTGLYWDTSRFTTSGVLVVVPEPSRWMFLMIGCAGLCLHRRRSASKYQPRATTGI